ncbi:Lrp/AsnC family transcriptional regulator [Rhizorhapis suberifaciens]|uniref:DNA-binding Lrp family transcriptional regulator n=1 Tax=Rhizorhapis suberifaciens TaxID=13656 RepID=A0A840HZ77_9SPHN|nr:Lrp/AsnC family transcriptional regulator [Rhizorhapis suberifaciens]MBB4642818.1 DNA-binding Lrp family transcriptional regulator [Rhizorhapis suberifaciens]
MAGRSLQSLVLTEVDRAILDALTADPLASARAVAETLGAPVAQVTARMRALDRRRVSHVLAVLDLAAAGEQVCFVSLEIKGRSLESVAADIRPIPEVMLISTLVDGQYDLLLMIRFGTPGSLHGLMANRICTIAGIYRVTVSTVLDIPSFQAHYVRFDSSPEPEADFAETMSEIAQVFAGQVDELDCQIITELLGNARQSINTIARKYQINASTIRYRVRSLESRGLMRFITVLDPKALGIQVFALVEIEPRANCLADVVASLRGRPWLPQIFVTTGPAPIKGIMHGKDMHAIKRIKNEELTQIEGIIDVTITTLSGAYKNDTRWGNKYT